MCCAEISKGRLKRRSRQRWPPSPTPPRTRWTQVRTAAARCSGGWRGRPRWWRSTSPELPQELRRPAGLASLERWCSRAVSSMPRHCHQNAGRQAPQWAAPPLFDRPTLWPHQRRTPWRRWRRPRSNPRVRRSSFQRRLPLRWSLGACRKCVWSCRTAFAMESGDGLQLYRLVLQVFPTQLSAMQTDEYLPTFLRRRVLLVFGIFAIRLAASTCFVHL